MNHAEMQFLTTEFPYKKQYGNFIGGEWVKPVGGEYFDNVSRDPENAKPLKIREVAEMITRAVRKKKVAPIPTPATTNGAP